MRAKTQKQYIGEIIICQYSAAMAGSGMRAFKFSVNFDQSSSNNFFCYEALCLIKTLLSSRDFFHSDSEIRFHENK